MARTTAAPVSRRTTPGGPDHPPDGDIGGWTGSSSPPPLTGNAAATVPPRNRRRDLKGPFVPASSAATATDPSPTAKNGDKAKKRNENRMDYQKQRSPQRQQRHQQGSSSNSSAPRQQQAGPKDYEQLRGQLRRSFQSIEYYGNDPTRDVMAPPSPDLVTSILRPMVDLYERQHRPGWQMQTQQWQAGGGDRDHDGGTTTIDTAVLFSLLDRLDGHIVKGGGGRNESPAVRERVLGLLAVLMRLTGLMELEQQQHQGRQHGQGHSNSNNNLRRRGGGGATRHGENDAADGSSGSGSASKGDPPLDAVPDRLWESCRAILDDMASSRRRDGGPDRHPLVSPIAVTAMAKALQGAYGGRRMGRDTGREMGVTQILDLLDLLTLRHGRAEDPQQPDDIAPASSGARAASVETTDYRQSLVTAWNMYLSSLCDTGAEGGRNDEGRNPNRNLDAVRDGIDRATRLLLWNADRDGTDDAVAQRYGIEPDLVSYNVVLHAAAKVGNSTLVDRLWQDLLLKRDQQQALTLDDCGVDGGSGIRSLQPTSRTYNALLRATKDMDQRLDIWDKEILPQLKKNREEQGNGGDVFDSFTIDFVLLPLVRANRKHDLFRLVEQWMSTRRNQAQGQHLLRRRSSQDQQYQRALQEDFSAFFVTLAQPGGSVATARELFDQYMVPSGSDISTDKADSYRHTIPPQRRHFNILLDGYARRAESAKERLEQQEQRFLAFSHVENADDAGERSGSRAMRVSNFTDGESEDDMFTQTCHRTIYEDAITDGQELFQRMLDGHAGVAAVAPDAYTWSSMTKLCRNGTQVKNLINQAAASSKSSFVPIAVIRAAITACGKIGDPSMACILFDQYIIYDILKNTHKSTSAASSSSLMLADCRTCNVLLGALAAGAKHGNTVLDIVSNYHEGMVSADFLTLVGNVTCSAAVQRILNVMGERDSQSYTMTASALQYSPESSCVPDNNDEDKRLPLAMQIFRNATKDGIVADGRFINAVIRCFGEDIAGALDSWKNELRRACLDNEIRPPGVRSKPMGHQKMNLAAAYNGILYVSGRALRPDVAVRVVYAMNREGIEPSEHSLNNYRAGKRMREVLLRDKEKGLSPGKADLGLRQRIFPRLLPKLDMVAQYESVLNVECNKYNTGDRRLVNDMRVRIIV